MPDDSHSEPAATGGSPLPGKCGAALRKKPGRFCRRDPLHGKTRCRLHGGQSLGGIAHPKFKHGRYAKPLRHVRDVSRHYVTHRSDPESIHCLDEIALNQARISQLLELLPSGETGQAWKRMVGFIAVLIATLDDFDGAMATRNTEAAGAAIRSIRPLAGQMSEATNEGLNESACWDKIGGHLVIHTKLVTAETRRQQVSEQSMSAPVVFALIGSIVAAFAEVEIDREKRRMFHDKVHALMAPSSAPVLEIEAAS